MSRPTLLGLAAVLLVPSLLSQVPVSQHSVLAVRTTEHISIDGRLNEKTWHRPGFTGFQQQEPFEAAPPSQRSEIWVAFDDEALYFAARYFDDHPDSILARLVRRDFIWGDPSDGCVLYIDSFRDRRNGYFFYVSAAGTLADGLIENDVKQPNDLSWDAVWDGVAKIDGEGYCIEMKIPFSQLRFREGDVQNWGINAERFISRRAETDMIAITPRTESGFASRFLNLEGIVGVSPSARIETMPYVTSKAEYTGHDPSNPFNPGEKYRFGGGLDIRAGLGSSLTLNATINPDFGQVEVDPAIVNLTDVESTFDEKRPFFTEGVTLFNFGEGGSNNQVAFNWQSPQIFYSRRIGRAPQGAVPGADYIDAPNGTHILGAGKISGRVFDEWKLGMIHSLTEREFASLDLAGVRSQVEIEPLTYYGVLRTQRDFNAGGQGIGLLTTYTNRLFHDEALRSSLSGSAVAAGIDGWTFLDEERSYVITGWGSASRVSGTPERLVALQRSAGHYFQRPDAHHLGVDSSTKSLTGYAGRLVLNKNNGRWILNTALGCISPGYEVNDLGYETFADQINGHIYGGYRWTTPTEFYMNAGVNAAMFANWDFGGNKTAQGYWLGAFIMLRNLYGANLRMTYSPETFSARRTRGGPLTLNPVSRSYFLNFYTDGRQWYVVQCQGAFRIGEDLNSRALTTTFEFKVTPTLTLSIGPQLQVDTYGAQWVGVVQDPTAAETYGNRYLFAHMDQTTIAADIRMDWIISPTLSVQLYVQPLISSGRYSGFKSLAMPRTYRFAKYGENGSTIVPQHSSTGELESYELDPDGSGPAAAATIGNPDFNIVSLRGNAVLRWEYLPGSVMYLVWTQSRSDYEAVGDVEFGHSMNHLFAVKPDNIFMLKLSYWLGM
jgi:hypothetical protein